MSVKTSITLTTAGGRNPFAQSMSKRRMLNEFGAKLKALAGGVGGGLSERTTLRAGTAAATGTVTCAAVQNADTVTINGAALTATQHHSRGTVTPTVSGIDLNDTVTIGGVVLTAKQHYAKGTITLGGADAADNVTVAGVTFVGTAGAVTPGAATYSIDTGNTEAATSLAAQINAHAVASLSVSATSASAVVTVRSVAAGTAGNAIALTTTDGTDLAVSGATLTGATNPTTNEFDFSGTNAQCCASLAACINGSPDLVDVVTAWASATVVTVRAASAGTTGDAITLVSSDAQLAVSGATLSGGAAVTNNTFDFGGSDTETATALATAIGASTTSIVGDICHATNVAGLVTVAARASGTSGNACTLASSNGTRLLVSGARLTGGTDLEATF